MIIIASIFVVLWINPIAVLLGLIAALALTALYLLYIAIFWAVEDNSKRGKKRK